MSGRLIVCSMVLATSVMLSPVYAAQQMCNTLLAVVHANAQPFDWQDARTGISQGLSIDLLAALAEKTQLDIQRVTAKDASKALREVRSGRVDLIIGVHSEPQKDSRLDYLTPAYAQQDYRIWLRAGEQASLQQWPQLSGLRGVRGLDLKALPGFDAQAQQFNWPLRSVQGTKAATQMVLQGRADYLLAEQHHYQLYLQEAKLTDLFEMIEPPVATRQLFVALSKDSACNDVAMRNTLSKALVDLTQATVAQRRLTKAMQDWQTMRLHDASPDK